MTVRDLVVLITRMGDDVELELEMNHEGEEIADIGIENVLYELVNADEPQKPCWKVRVQLKD